MNVDYKGIQIPEQLRAVIPYMLDVELVRERLAVLGQQWDLLTILGQVCGSGADMTATREEFATLSHQLISNLALESLRKYERLLQFKAQVAIDIVIRNLFERTADIGFLATDVETCSFLRHRDVQQAAPEREALAERFRAYRAKYSVYSDVVLLGTEGEVLCRSRSDRPLDTCQDPYVHEARCTSEPYVEYFGPSVLAPDEIESLIYAYRVVGPEGRVGVLCLVFRFQDELAGVFRNLRAPRDWTLLCLVSREGHVVATSDPLQLPTGTRLDVDGADHTVRLGGRLYLVGARRTTGYQGYEGPGWMGCALVPIEHAFLEHARGARSVDERTMELISHSDELFSVTLREIAGKAEGVQKELDRTVWNGHLVRPGAAVGTSTDTATRVLLREISATGGRTKGVFENAIGDLYQTVLGGVIEDARATSALAIDIMDRNLYERANDCRWWALTTSFRELLAAGSLSRADVALLDKTLAYINGLYTVYTALVLYDAHGTVVSVSTPELQAFVGTVLEGRDVAQVLRLRDPQCYAVSAFQPTPLYGGESTYVYGAAVLSQSGQVVGGIGLVFDSGPQFKQMLRDALPKAARGASRNFAVFVGRDRRVLACSNERIAVGSELELDRSFFGVAPGATCDDIIPFQGRLYSVAATCSAGYREYKSSSDSYKNDIIAITFFDLAEDVTSVSVAERRSKGRLRLPVDGEPTLAVASFAIGHLWLSLPAEDVVEAIATPHITLLPTCPKTVRGVMRYRNTTAVVLDAALELGFDRTSTATPSQVVVVKHGAGYVGLVVDELGDVADVPLSSIELEARVAVNDNVECVRGVIRPPLGDADSGLLLLLNMAPFLALVLRSVQSGANLNRLKELVEPEPLADSA